MMGYINFCSLPYTFRRNGTFYLYFRLPDNRFFKSSLACTEIKRARFLTSRLMFFISLLKLGRIENSQLQTIVRKMRQLTQSDIDDYLLEVQTEIYEEARRTKFEAREASTSGGKPIPVDLAKGFSEFAGEHLEGTFYNGAKPFSNDHITDYFSAQFDVTGMENQLMEASVQHDYFLGQWQDARTAFFSKNLKDYDAIVKSLEPITPSVPIHITAPTADDSNSENQLTLAEAWNDFLKYKSSWTDKIRKNNEKYFEVMAIVLGKNTAVTKISKQDIKRLLEVAEALPQQNKKPYNRMTSLQIIDLDNIPPCDLVSGKTVKDYLKLCQSFFSAFLTKEKDILSFSPTENIKYEYSSKRYGVYTLNEMTKLVNQFLLEKGWKKWVFLLLAYTGARRNEITSLTVNNVRFDNDTKRYYLMIEESKTDAGIRQIPLHTKLIDWGFIDFVNSKGNGSLFPEITYNNQVTNVFHTIRNSLEINYLDDYKDRRIVHSFRHTFFTNAVTKQNITLVQQVVGHEHSDTGVSQVYTHRVALHRLLCVVDSIDWV
ncbi:MULTISPECIES: tyrosine-type recombinase/integrase [Yersinia]|uniref:tyrosine-type recombinase/integrase n=1 Tax=Yersinia TaxID=629 RepID=UPI0021BD4A36|nr:MULTISPECIES: tyrosine-type recombinase/integrase [Yersinia]MCW6584934.1 tyrosine-type recombinase/integrase [Yersinia ruckeri]